jgi:NAD(P)-dependent dehydrogenase (short-subunit alcohol dehydrogenase family)
MSLLEGKIAVVTGAGKRKGMGAAAALKMAAQGASVVVTDVCRSRKELEVDEIGLTVGDDFTVLEKLVEEIEAAGGKGLAMALDVTDVDQIKECVQKTRETFGGVDILFNNAGVAVGIGPFLEISGNKWDLSWQVNVMGMMELCRAVIPEMQARGGGSIINTSSIYGIGAAEGYAGYTTTKFAVVGLTKAIAAEFGGDGIRCNAICPGNILTDMGEAEVNFYMQEKNLSREEALKLYGAVAALGRGGQPEEIGALVAFLAGEQSAFMTGAAMPITGGMPYGI